MFGHYCRPYRHYLVDSYTYFISIKILVSAHGQLSWPWSTFSSSFTERFTQWCLHFQYPNLYNACIQAFCGPLAFILMGYYPESYIYKPQSRELTTRQFSCWSRFSPGTAVTSLGHCFLCNKAMDMFWSFGEISQGIGKVHVRENIVGLYFISNNVLYYFHLSGICFRIKISVWHFRQMWLCKNRE